MDELITNMVIGMLAGLVCGIAPLIVALKKRRAGLAILSLVLCGICGIILGVILAAPVAGILAAIAVTMENGSD
jgi:hypothetical protein